MIGSFRTDDKDELIRAMAADDITGYVWNIQEYIHNLSQRGDFDEDGRRLLDLIIGEMEHERTALVEAALDTWV